MVIVGVLTTTRGYGCSLILLCLFNYVSKLSSAQHIIVALNHWSRYELNFDIFIIIILYHLALLSDSKLLVLDSCLADTARNVSRHAYSLILLGTDDGLSWWELSTAYYTLCREILLERSKQTSWSLLFSSYLNSSIRFFIIAQINHLMASVDKFGNNRPSLSS